MKILFVHPNKYLSNGIPTGIATLSAILKARGHQVKVFDTTFLKTQADVRHDTETTQGTIFKKTAYTLNDLIKNDPVVTHPEAFQQTIDAFNPDLIAISTMTPAFDKALDLFTGVNRRGAKVIVGGVHPTIALEDCLAQEIIDIACIGEGDEVLPMLCDRMEGGKDFYDVPSMAFKMPDGSSKINPIAPRITDLNQLPCPDWGVFDPRHLFRPYEGKIYNGSFFSSSRGCPMRCTYCIDGTVAGMTGGHKGYFRTQSPEVTAAHLRTLVETYDARWFKFVDDTFLLHPLAHLEKLRDLIVPLGLLFGCSIMPNTITREKVALAKEMGCVAMSIGVESGNPEIRQSVNRKYNNDDLVRKLAIIKDFDIRISTFNMIGFPNESRQNVFETIRLNRRIKASACNVYILYPDPGTPISREFKIPLRDAQGRIPKEDQATQYGLSQMSEKELTDLQKTFNFYLLLPETLWPMIQLVEEVQSQTIDLLPLLSRLVSSWPCTQEAQIPFTQLLDANNDANQPTFNLPPLFAEIWSLPWQAEHKQILKAALQATFANNTPSTITA